jgi:hypothetical protein
MQREKLSDALYEVHKWQPGSLLSKLWQIMGQMRDGRFVVHMQSAMKATLHQGTTKLGVKKHRVGSTEDCYAFVPYKYPEGDAELNVMEVHGIAVLRWHPEDAEDDVLGAVHQQEAAHADDVEDALAIPGTLRRSQALEPPSC